MELDIGEDILKCVKEFCYLGDGVSSGVPEVRP